jgi:hypothetical protein
MANFVKTIVIIAASIVVLVFMASADEVVQYPLDRAKVADARLLKLRNELSVQIRLDKAETSRFAELTKNNVGKMFQVVLDDQVLIEAVVRAEIDSGFMAVRVSDEAEAEQLIQKLKPWQEELRGRLAQAFHTTVEKSYVNSLDYKKGREYPVTRFAGEGSLKQVFAPTAVIKELFNSDGWYDVLEYTADKPGSYLSAYRKDSRLCIVDLNEDTLDCDAEVGDFVPSQFEFFIDCREVE